MKRIPTACTVVAFSGRADPYRLLQRVPVRWGDGIHRFHRDDRHDNGSHHDGGSPCAPRSRFEYLQRPDHHHAVYRNHGFGHRYGIYRNLY